MAVNIVMFQRVYKWIGKFQFSDEVLTKKSWVHIGHIEGDVLLELLFAPVSLLFRMTCLQF